MRRRLNKIFLSNLNFLRTSSLAFLLVYSLTPFAKDHGEDLNVLAWGGEISYNALKKFEAKTGVTVHVTTFDSNEAMLAKLKLSNQYDVVLTSSYFIEKLKEEHYLSRLDHAKLPNLNNIDPFFLDPSHDKQDHYELPFLWGVTGLFYNKKISPKPIYSWRQLWAKKNYDRLLVLDDPREVFSMALLVLGYSPNDSNPKHLIQAYKKLEQLLPNIKLFATNTLKSVIIDEDLNQGMAWNGDVFKSQKENPNVVFTFPEEGFVIWVDGFALLKSSRDPRLSHEFINFMLSKAISEEAAINTGFTPTNIKAVRSLPASYRRNPIFNPDKSTLKKGHFQTALPESSRLLIQSLWQKLKTH